MIVVKLMGGLGNQMFQYAAGRCLALRHNVVLKADLSFLNAPAGGAYTGRTFALDQLNIATLTTDGNADGFSRRRFNRVISRLLPSAYKRLYLAERGHQYQRAFNHAPADTYLDGFWQNERYFLSCQDVIRKELAPKDYHLEAVRDVAARLGSGNTVSVHVRRGDYVSLPQANAFHGTCEPSYYHAAVRYISEHFTDPTVYVFSDDPDWCRKNLSFGFQTHFMEPADFPARDLWLMSHCAHHVIANSSFSWWGAWLNERPGKIVVAPREWLRGQNAKALGIVPERWITL